MGKIVDEAKVNALQSAYYYEEMRVMMHMIYRAIESNSLRGYEKDKLEECFSFVNNMLFKKESDAYRTYFMWNLAGSDEEHEKAKRVAYQRYLKEGMAVMQYLNGKLKHEPSYLGVTEEEFRADIEKEFSG